MSENEGKRKRTKRCLTQALVELCGEKPYYQVTISDICERAGTYRSTFYRYFDTKDEMLREVEREYIADTRRLTPSVRNFRPDASPEEYAHCREELKKDMEYHYEHRELCKFLLSPGGDLYFYEKMIESIIEAARENDRIRNIPSDAMREYVQNFFATGFIASVHDWLNKGDCTSEQIADSLLKMMKQLLCME